MRPRLSGDSVLRDTELRWILVARAGNALGSSALLTVLGYQVDAVSMVVRTVTVRIYSPEQLRGRIASVNFLFIGASNELGAFESGIAAAVFGVLPAVALGCVVTLAVTAFVATFAPKLRRLDLRVARLEAEELHTPVASFPNG
ncbi:MAG: hypothetical protein LH650_15325 [Chloroflexi bacterium]|nr:hypothetical protein [Chloroflexota bacterium]